MKHLQRTSTYVSLERGCNGRSEYPEMSSIQVGPEFEQFYMMNYAMKYILFKLQMPATNLLQDYTAEDLASLLSSCLWAYQISLKSEEFSFESCSFVC